MTILKVEPNGIPKEEYILDADMDDEKFFKKNPPIKKWSDLDYDENQKAIRGFLLTKLEIDLNKIPTIFNQKFYYFKSKMTPNNEFICKKILLTDIIGTSYSNYGDMELIHSFMKIKRAHFYIQNGVVSKNKYFYMLKKPICEQGCPIILSRIDENKYFVDGNGNHRVILYKMMMLSEIANKYDIAYEEDFCDFVFPLFKDITKQYWLNAKIRVDHD